MISHTHRMLRPFLKVSPLRKCFLLFMVIFVGAAVFPVHAVSKKWSKKQASPLLTRGTQKGTASWYGGRDIGRLTASGEHYHRMDVTAAHRSLPFNTRVLVTNLKNGRHVVVRINDRGPYIKGRIIDLSFEAAKSIGMIHSGITPVYLQILQNRL